MRDVAHALDPHRRDLGEFLAPMRSRFEPSNVMSDAFGRIKRSVADARSGKLMFLSHCLLNQNACVQGIASEPATIRAVVDVALDNDVGIY